MHFNAWYKSNVDGHRWMGVPPPSPRVSRCAITIKLSKGGYAHF